MLEVARQPRLAKAAVNQFPSSLTNRTDGEMTYFTDLCILLCGSLYGSRPDITAQDDWAQNTNLLTYLLCGSQSTCVLVSLPTSNAKCKDDSKEWTLLPKNGPFLRILTREVTRV